MSNSNPENPNALKLLINPQLIDLFVDGAITLKVSEDDLVKLKELKRKLKNFELKERIQLVSSELYQILGDEKLVSFLDTFLKDKSFHQKIKSLQWWPISDLVERYSLKNPRGSFEYLLLLTEVFTSEFAIRSILNQDPKLVLAFLKKASRSKNLHHRRLASEGARPLLPWGKKAIAISGDPSLTEEILNNLKFDDEIYVRKSVANHLNDFSKLHPDFVLTLLAKWNMEVDQENRQKIEWITKHALRTLIKKGNKEALELVNGKLSQKIKIAKFILKNKKIKIGDKLNFDVEVLNPTSKSQKFVLEYIIGFKLKTGKIGYKTFKGTSGMLEAKALYGWSKSHSFKPITTRSFYSGIHEIKLLINGIEQGKQQFHLK